MSLYIHTMKAKVKFTTYSLYITLPHTRYLTPHNSLVHHHKMHDDGCVVLREVSNTSVVQAVEEDAKQIYSSELCI